MSAKDLIITIIITLVTASGISAGVYSFPKYYTDFTGLWDKFGFKRSAHAFLFILALIFAVSLCIAIFIKSDTKYGYDNPQINKIGKSINYNRNPIDKTAPNDDDRTKMSSRRCIVNPQSDRFYQDVDSCLATPSCVASVQLCNGAAQAVGRTATTDITCPTYLGPTISLDQRRDISDRLRQRRCYPESYSWLAGLPGPEADDARGAWRAKVCPEEPEVFSNPLFAQLGPITDGPCSR